MWPRALLALAVGVLIGAVGATTLLSSLPGGAGARPTPLTADMFAGPYYAPNWPCGGAWELDKSSLAWLCVDSAFNVLEQAYSPQLATKIQLAAQATWPCDGFEGFTYSAIRDGCVLPDGPIVWLGH